MKRICCKLISIAPIGFSVGCLTFITALVAQSMEWTIWLSFLSWALYFLHGGKWRSGLGAFISFIYGIFLAQLALWYIAWLMPISGSFSTIIVPSSVFFVAFVITITMRLRNLWATFIPAVYIGTVFRFAFIDLFPDTQTLMNMSSHLAIPIIWGLFIGWCTVSLLEFLNKIGLSKWHTRWEIDLE